MAWLLDTNLWIDMTRTRSPQSLKAFIAPYILDSQAYIAEPIVFEVLRHATDAEARQLTTYFQSLPLLGLARPTCGIGAWIWDEPVAATASVPARSIF
jgi:predicted nucleic acid-binding protein